MNEPKWQSCGKCENGWVRNTIKVPVRRFIANWIADEVGGDGRFEHPVTQERMRYHDPIASDDPDFTVEEIEQLELVYCPCHLRHWSRRPAS